MITKDIKELNQPCQWVGTVKEGEEISVKLFRELITSKNGIGLAANQIGIDKRVCVINVKQPYAFINPRITDKSKETFPSTEGCLSFPNKRVRVKRYKWVAVECDNFKNKMIFSAETDKDIDATECACIQHEIDHINGITMFDREFIIEPIVTDKKYGRNERVEITNGQETKTLKWKKAKGLVDEGVWQLT